MSSVTLSAPAKVNLFLHVMGKRADGYHLLDSLVMFADYGDTLELSPAEEFRLTVEGAFSDELSSTSPDDNLVSRAAMLLAKQYGVTPAIRVHLTKNLPIGAGIGGGSSDAAALLRGLSQLWQLKVTGEELAELSLVLGADMPVCVHGTPARIMGIGEVITPHKGIACDIPVLLVNPRVEVPSQAIYRMGIEPNPEICDLPASIESPEEMAALIHQTRNDLQPNAIAYAPQIQTVLSALSELPGCLAERMSGSGATCIGIFPDETGLFEAAERLRQHHPEWWVQPSALLRL